MTREQWLQEAVAKLRPLLAQVGCRVPEVHVSVGFPSRKVRDVLGQCWQGEHSTDGRPHVFVTPRLADPLSVLATLLHELIHASGAAGHAGVFQRAAGAVGFEAPWTQTPVSSQLHATLVEITDELPPYPHAQLTVNSAAKKQGTRLLKLACPDDGYTVRTTQKWLDVGVPTCPCGSELVIG